MPYINRSSWCWKKGWIIFFNRHLREKYKIEIGGGLGPLEGKTWRIGLMGHTARRENAERLLSALEEIIQQ